MIGYHIDEPLDAGRGDVRDLLGSLHLRLHRAYSHLNSQGPLSLNRDKLTDKTQSRYFGPPEVCSHRSGN
jgi:hypothetical protein